MKKILCGLTALMLFCGCSAQKDVFTIELDENPTTGYSWSCTVEPDDMITELENVYQESEAANPPLLGAGGKRIYKFRPQKDGIVTLTFTYARPWAGGETDKTRVISCKITNGRIEILTDRTAEPALPD